MKPGSRDLVAFLDEEVLPRLTPASIWPAVKWTSISGRYWRGPCPIHGGDNPTAFSVDTVSKGWKCFTHCGSGSAVAYISNPAAPSTPTGRDFVEAVKKLAAFAGVPFPELERTPEEVKRAEERNRREDLLRAFLSIVQDALQGPAGKEARAYLAGRGLVDTAAEDLGLFTTRAAVMAALTSKGFTPDEVKASGVVHDGRWEGRLVIPWRDRRGNLGTFAARDLTGTAEEAQKYLYMTGTKKADLVAFGLDQALQRRPDHLVLVEGLLDVVNLQARGLVNVAAIGGAGGEMTAKRWEALAALGAPPVVLALDNDEPGRAGTVAAVENIIKGVNGVNSINVPVNVLDPVHLGEAKDPDAFVHNNGVDAFRALLDKREPAAVFLGRHYLGDVTPESPVHVRQDAAAKVSAFVETLREERTALHVEELLHLTAARTGYTLEALVDVGKRHEERRLKEERERLLDAALRKATSERVAGKDPEDVAHDLVAAVSTVKAKTEEEPPPFSVDRLLAVSKETPAGKRSGWSALDSLGVTFNAGELSVLGARPGHCKTSALVGLMVNFAKEEKGDAVMVLYSHEEPEVFIFHRLLALLSGKGEDAWSSQEVRDYLRGGAGSRGKDYKWPPGLKLAQDLLRQVEPHLLVVHRPEWTVEEIVSHARRLNAHHAVGAVLVDYLQRIPAPGGGEYERRDIQVSAVARLLKDLAGDLAVPVIAGAQVGREAVPKDYYKNMSGKTYEAAKAVIKAARPALHQLREGGSEQEADLVLGLLSYGADFSSDEDGERSHDAPPLTLLEVGTLKHRYGKPGRWAKLAFEGKAQRVRDPENWDKL